MSRTLGFAFLASFSCIAGGLFSPFEARAQAARDVEPVVLTGANLPSWSGLAATVVCQPYPSGAFLGGRDAHNGIPVAPPALGAAVDEIAAFRWDAGVGAFVEIPVQVDERFYYCLSNPPSDFALYSGTDKELTYAWDEETWRKVDGECFAEYPPGLETPDPDPVPTLDHDDEVVFMASDAGPVAPLGAPWPAGATDSQLVALTDPLDPATLRFVYLFLKPGGSSFDASNGYVSYVRDPDADEWIDRDSIRRDDPEILGVSNTGYGPNLVGSVCRTSDWPAAPGCAAGTPCPDGEARTTDDRFVRDGVTVTTDTYAWRASGRWMVRGLQVAKPGQPGLYGPDLIDRWKGRAFQQSPDSSISLVGFEDEQVNWEANSALLGERRGPVRAIREVWGADSGTNVTKTETFYRDAITYRYHVRVHPIPPDGLYTSWDYNAGAVTTYYNVLKPDGVAIDGLNDDVGSVDEAPFVGPAFFDAPDPTFNAPSAILNWEQISGAADNGSLVYIIELKGATTLLSPAVVPYYRDDGCLDDGTGDDPVARPWPGEASTDARVRDGYCVSNGQPAGCNVCLGTAGGGASCDVDCAAGQTQGAYAAHGVHYFVTGDTDNLASPEVLTEIDAQQWQFVVPTAAPANVGQAYGNVVIAPLHKTALADPGIPGPAPPSAGDVAASTGAGQPVVVVLTGLDLDTCELTFAIAAGPANGSIGAIADVACAAGMPNADTATITYTPAPGFVGDDTFTYTVGDGLLTSAPAAVTVTVSNQRPVAAHVEAATSADTPVEIELRASDEEECELAFSVIDPPLFGTLSAIADDACEPGSPLSFDTARVTYTPEAGFTGEDTFTYVANDGLRDSTPPARATVHVGLPAVCGDGPVACRTPQGGRTSSVLMKDGKTDRADLVRWKWSDAGTVAAADFGSPIVATGYALCVYDAGGSAIAGFSFPADGDCADGACWESKPKGFRYRARTTSAAGRSISSVGLRAGDAGKPPKLDVKVKGPDAGLDDFGAGIEQPVTVQLFHEDGGCWGTVFDAPAHKSTDTTFKDRTP